MVYAGTQIAMKCKSAPRQNPILSGNHAGKLSDG